MTRRLLVGLLTIGALVLGLGAAPAAAHVTDPWTGTDTVCREGWCVNTGNLVILWQSILYVDGRFTDPRDIDGSAGDRTHWATQNWQKDRQLKDDGKAGPKTWGKAREQLRYETSIPGAYHLYYYQGRPGYRIEVREYNDGTWRFRHPITGAILDTSHGA